MKLLFFVSIIASEIMGFDPTWHRNWNFLRHDICGQSITMKIVGGQEAEMNSYPWMAQIGQAIDNNIQFYCGGAIINSKTVVTAAHCIPPLESELEYTVIRLGEHDLDKDPDCNIDYCADPVVDVKPAEIIMPRDYDMHSYKHDIALIVLRKEIKFTDFIRPICMPFGKLLKKNYIGSAAEVAGWGVENIETNKTSTKLQFAKLIIRPHGACLKHLPPYLAIGPTQLCVGGDKGMDSCIGDSGGPLMKVDDGGNGPRYYLLGVVSFGSIHCGTQGVPGIYTNIFYYMEWILDNLKATEINATGNM